MEKLRGVDDATQIMFLAPASIDPREPIDVWAAVLAQGVHESFACGVVMD